MLSTDELSCIYSALILQDDEIAVTPEKISTLLKAAGVDVESYWPGLFARALEGVDIKQMITNVGAGAPAAASGEAASSATDAEKTETKKEEKKEESDEDDDDDMGFGLFD